MTDCAAIRQGPGRAADALARSPASIASFLEAGGSAALEQAGKILVRRT